MLRVNLQALHRGAIETIGEIPPHDPALQDVEFTLRSPVRVTGRLMESGAGSYFWDARVRVDLEVSCRRCLRPVPLPLDQRVRALFTEDEATDDPSAYPIPHGARELDLAAAVREEVMLAVPEFSVCREECRGLCPRCGADLNTGSCGCRPHTDPRWAVLEGLKARPADE